MDTERRVSVFGGSKGGTPWGRLREFTIEWQKVAEKDWEKIDIETLDTMWLAADIGEILTRNGYQVVTGGYNQGVMGMATRAAAAVVRRNRSKNLPIGVPIENYAPHLYVPDADVKRAVDRYHRLGILLASEAYIALRGGGGTWNEIVNVLDEQSDADETSGVAHKPLIIADTSETWLKELTNSEILRDCTKQQVPTFLDRVYILEPDCFEFIREHPTLPTCKLTPKGELEILNILSGRGEIESPTLREILIGSGIE